MVLTPSTPWRHQQALEAAGGWQELVWKELKKKILLTVDKDGKADWIQDHHSQQRDRCEHKEALRQEEATPLVTSLTFTSVRF